MIPLEQRVDDWRDAAAVHWGACSLIAHQERL